MLHRTDQTGRTSSFGVHRATGVPLSAFEAGALGETHRRDPVRPALPGTGDDVSSVFDLVTPRRLAVGGAVLAIFAAVLVLR
ncbi:MAG: hypothetical protein HLUCCA08_04590 [Rhodobacteraceae bacterium HLUCCA08]|nr:MAG: hypothetical protein HLUCCA08_04590 [Rhodobacteraceae bacterium HLUCCA08]